MLWCLKSGCKLLCSGWGIICYGYAWDGIYVFRSFMFRFKYFAFLQTSCFSISYDTSFWRLASLQIHDESSAQTRTHRSPFIFIAWRSRRLSIQPARRSPPSFFFSPATPLPLLHTLHLPVKTASPGHHGERQARVEVSVHLSADQEGTPQGTAGSGCRSGENSTRSSSSNPGSSSR